MTKANPADVHFELVEQQRAFARLRQAIGILERSKAPFIVEGGWAVAAYDSPAPSMDLDVLVDGALEPSVAARIESATGIQIHAAAAQDALGIDIHDSRTPNPLLGTDLSYTPHDLLDGHVQRRPIRLLDGLELPVPLPTQLAFMKLKAFHDRRQQWEACRQTYKLAAFPAEWRGATIRAGEPYWLRKCGKDLFDLAWLVHSATSLDEVEEVCSEPVWQRLRSSLAGIPLPIRQFATGMAERTDSPIELPATSE